MPQDREDGEGPTDVQVVELDEEEEERKEKAIEEACYVNRALCNLERKNHRACNLDCAAALRLNPTNIKAWYRASSACLALDKILEAEDSCARGLKIDPKNAALKTLATKISKRKQTIEEQENRRREREQRKMAEKHTLKLALKARNIPSRVTNERPDAEDAIMKLADPLDPSSTLSVPVIFLYPLHMQSDFIKAFAETETLGEHLSYILPLPWDEKGEYTPESVECYIETVAGGLIKAGKKLSLLKLLKSGKIEIVDGMLRVQVVPRSKAQGWIDDFKRRRLA
ncbi:hypothetical protein BDY21DRAFT_350760 [Lineolata rhizophorae]|uniref:Cns1/TTC4 wheel domain-containing protein n=1 Tax=Lineolata rhizophorae TaxID=578093 RepID=A0A6A6NV05_9PEZI|nr:hypothetical protein BDY21DRAFT_350760 [Lineolata rhizophorae]